MRLVSSHKITDVEEYKKRGRREGGRDRLDEGEAPRPPSSGWERISEKTDSLTLPSPRFPFVLASAQRRAFKFSTLKIAWQFPR